MLAIFGFPVDKQHFNQSRPKTLHPQQHWPANNPLDDRLVRGFDLNRVEFCESSEPVAPCIG
jgi:hypothetical protein